MVGEEMVIINLDAKIMYGLNESGAFLWQRIETVSDVDQLSALTKSSDGINPFDEAILQGFFEELEELKLLRRIEPSDVVPSLPVEVGQLEELTPPRILWSEEVRQIAATCAFLPAMNPLCNQVPFS